MNLIFCEVYFGSIMSNPKISVISLSNSIIGTNSDARKDDIPVITTFIISIFAFLNSFQNLVENLNLLDYCITSAKSGQGVHYAFINIIEKLYFHYMALTQSS